MPLDRDPGAADRSRSAAFRGRPERDRRRERSCPAIPPPSGTSPARATRASRASRPTSASPRARPVAFKVDTDATDYRIDIYRLGWYGGLGARQVATVEPSATLPQTPARLPERARDAASSTAATGRCRRRGAFPANAVSGIYIAQARARRPGGRPRLATSSSWCATTTGGSELLFQTIGHHLAGLQPVRRQQPLRRRAGTTRAAPTRSATTARSPRAAPTPEDWVFNAEYPMVRWLERNGYDVSYTTGVDSDRRGAEILEHEVFLSVGHDEYWSAGQRANVEAARDAGVHLAFLSRQRGVLEDALGAVASTAARRRTARSSPTRRRTPARRSTRCPTSGPAPGATRAPSIPEGGTARERAHRADLHA